MAPFPVRPRDRYDAAATEQPRGALGDGEAGHAEEQGLAEDLAGAGGGHETASGPLTGVTDECDLTSGFWPVPNCAPGVLGIDLWRGSDQRSKPPGGR